MLGDEEDVFDSVTWESPAAPTTYEGTSGGLTGPGFRQSTSESEDGRGPLDPKWEGYLITTVKDPVKELAETKDAYVSYLVSAKASPGLYLSARERCSRNTTDQPVDILLPKPFRSETLPRLCLLAFTSGEGLSSMCRAPFAGQTQAG